MRFFARMSSNVASLMLETVESLVTKRALVGPRKILAGFFLRLLGRIL